MKFSKGDKVELANGTPCTIVREYEARDGQAYVVRWEDDGTTAKLTTWESYGVRERTADDSDTEYAQLLNRLHWPQLNLAEYCPQCGERWSFTEGNNRVTGACGHTWMNG